SSLWIHSIRPTFKISPSTSIHIAFSILRNVRYTPLCFGNCPTTYCLHDKRANTTLPPRLWRGCVFLGDKTTLTNFKSFGGLESAAVGDAASEPRQKRSVEGTNSVLYNLYF
ncbi:unnamed protein product, partial [Ectocarpus sp. 4 AP-2014]